MTKRKKIVKRSMKPSRKTARKPVRKTVKRAAKKATKARKLPTASKPSVPSVPVTRTTPGR